MGRRSAALDEPRLAPDDLLAAAQGVALVRPDRVASVAAVDVIAPAASHVEPVVAGAAAQAVATRAAAQPVWTCAAVQPVAIPAAAQPVSAGAAAKPVAARSAV